MIEDAQVEYGPDWRKIVMRVIIALIMAGALVGGCSMVNRKLNLPDDHWVEELAEDHIEAQIGIDIDLSHESPE